MQVDHKPNIKIIKLLEYIEENIFDIWQCKRFLR